MTRIFVYGTLMQGESNHGLLAHVPCAGQAETSSHYSLVDLGAFPGMLGGRQRIKGELYDVDDATLARIDRLEGHPSFYRRTKIRLADGSGAEAYLLNEAGPCRPIPSGSWRERRTACR